MTGRCWGNVGAMPNPQLPMTTVVTPCHDDGVRSGSHSDESWREHQAVEVDSCGIGRSDLADLGDAALAYGDVGLLRGRAGAVDDGCAPKNEIHNASPVDTAVGRHGRPYSVPGR